MQTLARRTGSFTVELSDTSKEAAALAAMTLFSVHPMWIVFNANETERAVLAERLPGAAGLNKSANWFPRSGTIQWVEQEPKIA